MLKIRPKIDLARRNTSGIDLKSPRAGWQVIQGADGALKFRDLACLKAASQIVVFIFRNK